MIGKVESICLHGYECVFVSVEVDILPGPMNMQIVGLGDNAVKESRDRIRSAITHSGFVYPVQQLIVNLAPNDRQKEGATAELAIAAAILVASGQLPQEIFYDTLLLGSLSLDGTLQNPKGMMSCVIEARAIEHRRSVLVPVASLNEVECIPGIQIYPLSNLSNLRGFCDGTISLHQATKYQAQRSYQSTGFAQIKGQSKAKSGLAYAAVGKHHSLMMGAPGTGKTMLAKAFESLMPPLSLEESLQTTRLYSVSGLVQGSLIKNIPFRSPHHTTSEYAMVGGGSVPQPGEVSLSHNGVLFLDELMEFKSATLQALREPLEEKKVTISRARGISVFPADFILIAAANPCRCGYFLSEKKSCDCTSLQVQTRYRKIVGPFLDRISIEIETTEESSMVLLNEGKEKSNDWWYSKIVEARKRMEYRNGNISNSRLSANEIFEFTSSVKSWKPLIEKYAVSLGLSHRGIINSLRLAMSIMDFKETNSMTEDILEQAFSFRVIGYIQKTLSELAA